MRPARIAAVALALLPLPLAVAQAAAGQAAAPKPARSFALKADSPTFWSLFDKDAQLVTVGTGFGFTEGPIWEPGSNLEPGGSLIVSDEETNELCRLYPDGHHDVILKLGDPDGNTRDAKGRVIVTASVLRAIIRLTPDEKSYTVLADRYHGMRLNSPNDVTLGPDGALYFTDPTLDLVKGERQETPFQGVYRLGADGALTLLVRDLSQPNGLAFSPDGRTLYVDDTDKRTIWRYDFRHGTAANGRLFAEEKDDEPGVPDGIKVDRSGNLYVTGPGGVWVWSPQGQRLGRIVLPSLPANLTWGGEDRATLFLTAGHDVYALKTRTTGYLPYADPKASGGAKPSAKETM